MPSKEIFSSIKFSGNILIKRMRELAFLNKGIKISFIDASQKKQKINDFIQQNKINFEEKDLKLLSKLKK